MAVVPRPPPAVTRLLIGVGVFFGVCVASAAPRAQDAAQEDAAQGARPETACAAAEVAEVSLPVTPSAKRSDSAESLLQRRVGRTGSENASLWEEPAEVPSNLTGRRGAAAAQQVSESDAAREHERPGHEILSCIQWLKRLQCSLLGGMARAAEGVSKAVGRRLRDGEGDDTVGRTLLALVLIGVGVVALALCARTSGHSFLRDAEAEAADMQESKSSHNRSPFSAPRSPDGRTARRPAPGHASPQGPHGGAARRDSAVSQASERLQRSGFSPALVAVSEDKAAQPLLSGQRPPSAVLQAPQLCPDLVVPEGSECTLLAPRLLELQPADGPPVTLGITDLRNAPVFKVVLNPSRGASFPTSVANLVSSSLLGSRTSARQRTTCISLESAQDDSVFAFAHDASMWFHGRPFGLEVCHASGQAYGQLCASTAEPGTYLMTCRGSGPVRFQRRRELGLAAIRVTAEDSGTLLAIAEVARDAQLPEGPDKRSVRIGPKVDAGFVALLIAGIDWLELHDREGPAQSQ